VREVRITESPPFLVAVAKHVGVATNVPGAPVLLVYSLKRRQGP